MLAILTVFSMICTAIWLKPGPMVDNEDATWKADGGDSSRLTPGLPVADDPDFLPEMSSDLEIRLEKSGKESP
ncbi:MAG TPA: hypothetical protein DIT64_11475 [Verrucomicrobiales bacterium]|nr:hypothetical protein [Verrucomicrobiales bacterium]HCN76754.1 hypothetical protein [Verrucomicrobiales bacterium]HRJ09282.1 hypothetical protein [Prosthecobacter sp.]